MSSNTNLCSGAAVMVSDLVGRVRAVGSTAMVGRIASFCQHMYANLAGPGTRAYCLVYTGSVVGARKAELHQRHTSPWRSGVGIGTGCNI